MGLLFFIDSGIGIWYNEIKTKKMSMIRINKYHHTRKETNKWQSFT